MNTLARADRKILEFVTFLVQKWMVKRDLKEHKVDFRIWLEWRWFYIKVIWAVILPSSILFANGEIFRTAFHLIFWSGLAGLTYFTVQRTTNDIKPHYDWLYAQRENPAAYKIIKEMMESDFERDRTMRFVMYGTLLGITMAFCILGSLVGMDTPNIIIWQFLFVNALFQVFINYLNYVFDFTPPKKKKKAESSITELVMRLWQSAVGDFAPQKA